MASTACELALTLKARVEGQLARTSEDVMLLHRNKKVGFWTHGNKIFKNICHYKLSPSNLDSKVTPSDLVSVFGMGAKIRTPLEV